MRLQRTLTPSLFILFLLLWPALALADFQAGMDAYNQGAYAIALKEFLPLAQQGNAEAQFKLGRLYQEGEGVPQAGAEAARWYRLAVAQGYAKAQYNLGVMYAYGQGVPTDYEEAIRWFRLAAKQGFVDAQTGEQVRTRKVTFEDHYPVSAEELAKVIASRDGDALELKELSNDGERIQEVYMNQGYRNVQVSQPPVELAPNREWLMVTSQVTEREAYTFAEISFQGNSALSVAELKKDSKIVAGEAFQRALVREEVNRLTDLYGEKGYSFAEVAPSIVTDDATQTATVIMNIKEGKLIRVRRIYITGNDRTPDHVIRREILLEEGKVMNTVALKRSFHRLANLFEKVEILPIQVGPDEVDVEVRVKEKVSP